MRNQAIVIPASVMRRDEDFAIPVGFRGLGSLGEAYEYPGTYGGLVPGGCGCGTGGAVASGVEGWVKAHPFLALGVAFLIGHAVTKKGR